MTAKIDPQLVLDARDRFGAQPIALITVLGRPWLTTFIDMIADAGATSRLTVIATPDTIDTINEILAKHSLGADVSVVTDIPPELISCALYATVSQVYVRHLFINAIKKFMQPFIL